MSDKDKDVVQIVAILDRSGSMESIREDAIGGFNSFIEQQKKLPGRAEVTLVLFDNEYLVPYKNKPLEEVEALTRETFVPRGMTALNDAIGRTLNEFESEGHEKVVVLIITDGAENASREFNSAQVKEKVDAAEDRGWDVNFLAANIDAFAAGAQYGMKMDKTFAFTANATGTAEAFATMSARSTSYRGVSNLNVSL